MPDYKRIFHLGLRRAKNIGADIENEITFHLQERVDALVARGWSEADAMAEAKRRFGDLETSRPVLFAAARQRERRLDWLERLDTLIADIKLSARQLRLAPTFAFGIIAAIALGIGANATMFGVIDRLMLRAPAGIASPNEVYTFERAGRGDNSAGMTYTDLGALRSIVGHDARLAVESFRSSAAMKFGDETHAVSRIFVDDEYFRMLGVHAARGRLISSDDIEPSGSHAVAVISYEMWQRQFGGDPNVVGRVFTINDERLQIIGVTERGFNGVALQPLDMWLPLPLASRLTFFGSAWNKNAVWLFPIARLSPGVDPTKIANQMTAFRRSMERDRPHGDTTITLEIHSILPSRGQSLSPEAKIAALLGGVSLLVLLVACTNAANLMLARAVRREREIAIRVALGVSRWRLIRQLIVDALLLSTLGAVAAIGIAALGSAIMRRVLLQGLVWEGSLVDARTLAFIAIATLVAALLSSAIPAWMVLHRVNVAHAIGNASARQAGRSQRSVAISSLVIAQTVLSAVLLIGALLFVRSLQNVRHVPVGMDVDHIVVASIDPKRTRVNDAAGDALFTELAAQAANLPGVKSAAITEGIPYLYNEVRRIAVPSLSPDLDWIRNGVAMQAVTPNYFATMGTRIVRGRSFEASEDRADGEPIAIINSSLANGLWPGVDAIGKCVQMAPKEPEKAPCRRIVGIVEDLRPIVTNADPHETSAVYVPLSQVPRVLYARVVIVRASNDATDLPRELLNLAHASNSVLPVADVWPMSSKLEPQLRPWKLGATMFGVFGALAFVLAALGTYSVIAYSVAQRRQEMGVRIALGAQTTDILALISRQGATLGVLGVAIALVVAAMLAPFVQPLLFNTSGRSVSVYATVGLSMVMVAVAASLIPAWRGARVDPLSAIRAE